MSDDDEPSYGLIMPFIACTSKGGPYDDAAFVAGHHIGELWALGRIDHLPLSRYVPSALVPQIDLVAMHYAWKMTAEPWEDDPSQTLVSFEVQP